MSYLHDVGRIVLYVALVLYLALVSGLPEKYRGLCYLPGIAAALLWEGIWSVVHGGITYDVAFDFLLSWYGFSMAKALAKKWWLVAISVVVITVPVYLLWPYRSPQPPGHEVEKKFLIQWGQGE